MPQKKLDKVYNLCFQEISNVNAFCRAISRHSLGKPLDLLFILSHGEQHSVHLSRSGRITTMSALSNSKASCLNGLAREAHIIFMSCKAGRGEDFMDNIANHFFKYAPSKARIFAATDSFLGKQLILWEDKNHRIRAKFWHFRTDALPGEGREPYDMTYEISGSKNE